jgi:hypothetical protein
MYSFPRADSNGPCVAFCRVVPHGRPRAGALDTVYRKAVTRNVRDLAREGKVEDALGPLFDAMQLPPGLGTADVQWAARRAAAPWP